MKSNPTNASRLIRWAIGGLASCFMTVSAFAQLSLTQTVAIVVNDSASPPTTASPYPSVITVSNAVGIIERVSVRLSGVTHRFPDDMDILLDHATTGTRVLLMSDAGGNAQGSFNGLTVTFADSAPFPMVDEITPITPPVTNGTYKPSNYPGNDGATDLFPGGPAAPFSSTLAAFNNEDPNGAWRLWVVDDQFQDGGTIASWTLLLETTPVITITSFTNVSGRVESASPTNLVTMAEDAPSFQFSFTIQDSSTPLGSVSVTATNLAVANLFNEGTNVIRNANQPSPGLALGGSGQSVQTLTITPLVNSNGNATIVLSAFDNIQRVSTSLFVTVTNVEDNPRFLGLTNTLVITRQGVMSTNGAANNGRDQNPMIITNADFDITNIAQFAFITNSALSSDNSIISSNHVFFSGTNQIRNVFFAPNGGATGSVTITLIATDPTGRTATTNITVRVDPYPDPTIFANTAPIAISDNATTTNQITVTNVNGLIGKVAVLLADVTHPQPSNLVVYLVGPGGHTINLLNNTFVTNNTTFFTGTNGSSIVAFSYTSNNAGFIDDRLLFQMSGPGTNALSPITNGVLSTTYGITSTNASQGNLDDLIGTNPNGIWTLYVVDSVTGATGDISGGWMLELFLRPTVGTIATLGVTPAAIPDQTVPEDTEVTVTFPTADWGGAIFGVTALTPGTLITNVVSTNLSGSAPNQVGTIVLRPITNAVGVTTVRIVASDTNRFPGQFFGTNTITITFTPVNDPPTNSVINRQVIRAGQSTTNIPFTIGDVETPATDLVVGVSSDNSKLLPAGSIVLTGSGANRAVQLFPAGVLPGTANVVISISDGTNTTFFGFELTVLEAPNPLFENNTLITINDNATATPFPSSILVSNLVGSIADVQVTLLKVNHPFPDDIDALLIGPTGQQILFMSDAGGANPIIDTTLIFADSATTPLPDFGQLVAGKFPPTDYDTSGDPDPAGSPLQPPAPTFASQFVGTNPNGTWSLFVTDDTLGGAVGGDPRGNIGGGWQLSIRTRPVVTAIPSPQVTDEDTVKRVSIIVGDNQPGVNLTITTNVSPTANTPSIIVTNITVEGTGAGRTLTITPVNNAFGTNQITVTVSDGSTSSSQSFLFVVNPVNDSPTISAAVSSTNTPAATAVTLEVTVGDIETSVGSLVLTADSSNKSLVPNANISLVGGGTIRTVTILPEGIFSGATTITLTVTDLDGAKTSTTVDLTVNRNISAANTAPITISTTAAGPATPYPSPILIQNIQGTVSKVTATLVGFTHSFPDDVDVLLVAPNGTAVMLMSDAGGGPPGASNLRLNFSSSAASPIPNDGPLTSGTFQPANYLEAIEGNETALPSPAPAAGAGGYGSNLGTLVGMSPNGTWNLYVVDDTFSDGGSINGGWILVIETGPTIALNAPGDKTTAEDRSLTIPFTVTDADTPATNLLVNVFATGTNSAILGLTLSGTSNDRLLTITNVTDQNGSNLVTLTVWDGSSSSPTNIISFGVIVTPVDDPPVLVITTNRVDVLEDIVTNIVFSAYDVDSVIGTTNITVTSLNQTIVPNVNIGVSGPNAGTTNVTNVVVSVTNAPNQSGTVTLVFSITDRNSTVTSNITFNVIPANDPPTISEILEQFVAAGESTTNINFTINDAETDAKLLTVTATSRDQTRVPNANILLGGSGNNRTIQLTTIGTLADNDNLIDVTVSDGSASTTRTFNLNISQALGSEFANPAPITIRDNTTADLYPSTINVFPPLSGAIHRVIVTLEGFTHTAPDDVDILLVSPTGKRVLLLSDTGGRNPVTNLRLRFDDNGNILADDAPITSGTNAPSNFDTNEAFPSPAPAGPYATRLSEFRGDSPNGVWSLYVVDDTANDQGQIAFGWSLRITTGPTITGVSPSPVVWNEDQAGVLTFNIADSASAAADLQLVYSSDNPALLPPGNITTALSGNTVTATLNSAANQFGSNNLTITVIRRADGAQASVTVPNIVNSVNDLPIITRLTPKTTDEDTPLTFQFQVTDADNANSNITLQATSSNQSVIGNSNLFLFGISNLIVGLPRNDVSFTLVPNRDAIGSSEITVTASDGVGSPVSSNFTFSVVEFNDPPTITVPIAQLATPAGTSTTNINFNVTDPENGTVVVTVSSSDQAIVKNTSIVVVPTSGPPGTRTVQVTPEAGVTGNPSVTITLRATDPGGKFGEASFVLNVRETRERIFVNSRPIAIQDNTTAVDYPSQINVSGLVGTVSKVTVTLNGFAHTFPDDVDILLVSPAGNKMVLMSDSGGGFPGVTNVVLKFDQAAAEQLPDGVFTSATYRPANYEGTGDVFPAPAPAGPYAASLDTFNGASPNGLWSLFIVDDTASDRGVITAGWSLGITTQPQIFGLTDMTVPEDTVVRENFTIAEESFASTAFTFVVNSTNAAVVPNSTNNIIITGTGTNRTIIVTPATNAFGVTQIQLNMTNPDGQSVAASFVLTFTPTNDAPVITGVADQTITAGGISPVITFSVSDAETANKDLIIRVTSSDPSIIPTNNIVISGNELRIFAGTQTGSSRITISVSDGQVTNAVSFLVTVAPSANPLFTTAVTTTIPQVGPATPYPSTITVSNVPGTVAKVTVTLAGLTHTFPDDLDILLVNPAGQKVILMSDAGAGGIVGGVPAALNNARLTFDDAAADPIPDATAINPFGTYRPADYTDGVDSFPAPAPAGPSATTLSAFNGSNPNGVWSLFIVDDAQPDPGSLSSWLLSITTTAPTISPIANQTLVEDVPATVNFAVGGSGTLTVTATVTNPSPIVAVTPGGSGANRTLLITPALNASGINTVVVSVTDGTLTAQTSFTVTVVGVNDAPVVTGLSDTNTPSNVPLRVNFSIFDVETAASSLTVAASTSNPGAGTISLEGTANARTLVFTPSGVSPTNTTVTVTVSDGLLTTTNTLVISVLPPLGPTISPCPLPDLLVFEDFSPLQVAFIVNQGTSTNITFTGTSSNTGLVSSITFGGSGSNRTAQINLVPDASGTATISITASDPIGSSTCRFALSVIAVDDTPRIAAIADQTTNEDVPLTLALNVFDENIGTLVLTSSNSNPALVTGVAFTKSGNNVSAVISVATNATGTASITITATDVPLGQSASRTFNLTVRTVDDAPVIGFIDTSAVNEDSVLTIPLNISDSDTPFASLRITGSSTNSNLVRAVTITTTPTNASATITLVTNASGSATITITAQDATNTTSQSFTLNVVPVFDAPSLAAIPNQTTTPGVPLSVPLSVSDPDRTLAELVFSASSSGTPSVVTGITFNNTGSNVTANILVANASGTNQVTITVTDPVFSTLRDSKTFTLTVANPPAPSLAIARITGGVRITLTGTPGKSYVIERSSFTVPITWSDVITLTVGASGTATADISTTSPAFQFFRARAL